MVLQIWCNISTDIIVNLLEEFIEVIKVTINPWGKLGKAPRRRGEVQCIGCFDYLYEYILSKNN